MRSLTGCENFALGRGTVEHGSLGLGGFGKGEGQAMGDMEGGGAGGASSWDSGGDAGGLAGSRALMGGGSLPPRKRLLAGLKQNGWLSTSPPSSVVSPTAAGHVAAGGNQAVGAVEGGVTVSGSGKHEDGCMGCSVVETNGMRRIKRGGVSLRLCSSCALLYTKSMFCPHCLAMYHDASLLGDPSMWLVCCRCRRSVHPECEHKHSGSIPEASTYVCLDCVNSAKRHRESNGITGMRSKPSSGRPGLNCNVEAGSCASAAAAAVCLSPSLKKPRMMRERSKPGDADHADASRLERHRLGPETVGANCDSRSGTLVPSKKVLPQPHLISGSSHEVAAAAKNAAAVAVKAAAVAKVNAAAKASAAVKAAAAAKAALEAAAHAARAEAAARAELRRKAAANAEPRLAGTGATKLEIVVHSETRRERTSARGEVKAEREEGHVGRGTGGGSIDDEELARQLHRVINSSPRISRSLTPMRRKASVKPDTPSSGVSNSSTEAGRAWPRPGGPSDPTHHQFKQQQTRPRSVTHKEFRRIDSRVSRHEVKKAEEGTHQTATQQVDAFEQSSPEAAFNHNTDAHSSHDIASVKTEAMEGVLFPHVPVQDEASILFDSLVEADGEGLHTAAGSVGSHDRRPDYLQEILEAAVLTDTAMSFNDGANMGNPELETVRAGAEGTGEQHQDVAPPGMLSVENEGGLKNIYGNMGETLVSGPPTLNRTGENASHPLQDVEMQEAGAAQAVSVAYEEGASGPSGATEVRSNRTSGEQAKGRKKSADVSLGSVSRPLVAGAVSVPGSEESNPVVSESLPQAASGHTEMGSTWQQSKLKAIPGTSQPFATGVSLAPFGSAAQIPIRTPAFASGPAGRHV